MPHKKVIGLAGVVFLASTLQGQSDRIQLNPGDAPALRISANPAEGRPCRSSYHSKENGTLSHQESLCGVSTFPQYPLEARKQHVQGSAHLKAVIGKDGLIKELQVIDGHPLLIASAIKSVKYWKYKPYRVKGKPVEVETVIP